MFIKQQFLSFPPNFVSARAEVVMSTQGSSVAIFGEWLACYFTPQIERLLSSKRMTVCDNIQVREMLELSGDWDRFTTAMKQLKLPPQSYEMLHAKTVELRGKIGEYWSRYNAAMEKPGDLWVPISPKDMRQIEDWFTKLKIDEAAFQQRVTRDGRYPVFWQIFEKGLCHHLRKKKSWPSASFRKMADWEERFEFMKRCSGPTFEEPGHIKDPVTLAGALENHYRSSLCDALNEQDFEKDKNCGDSKYCGPTPDREFVAKRRNENVTVMTKSTCSKIQCFPFLDGPSTANSDIPFRAAVDIVRSVHLAVAVDPQPQITTMSGWEVRMSKSKGVPYFYDPATSQSSWEPPAGLTKEQIESLPGAQYLTGGGGEPSRVRASHLLVKHRDSRRPSSWKEPTITRSKEEAIEILRGYQAQIGGNPDKFAELAQAHSDCSSHSHGGDLGWFSRGQMQKPFEDTTYGLEVGQMSDVISTDSGVHLILRTG